MNLIITSRMDGAAAIDQAGHAAAAARAAAMRWTPRVGDVEDAVTGIAPLRARHEAERERMPTGFPSGLSPGPGC